MARVLVVEDEAVVLVLAESILQELGHQTSTAATIDQALALLDTEEQYDLLFSDIGLGKNIQAGIELAAKARQRRPNLAVLYTTAQEVTDGMKAMFVDGFHLLAKPYTIEDLSAAVERALRKG